jgi:uncharacterized protein YjdB
VVILIYDYLRDFLANIVMEPTTGPANVCRGAVIALQNGTALPGNFSKQWLSSNSKATVNNNGNVTGISPGAVRITYKLNYSNPDFGTCSSAAIRDLAVLAIPATPAISFIVRPTYEAGTTSICLFSTFVLRGSLAGGTWSSAGAVTVNSNGLVTASSIGTGTVTYTVYNTSGCSYSRTVTYNVVSCETYAKSANTSAINKDAAPVLLTSSYKFILYPNPARTFRFVLRYF